ncbi:MAG TPA: 4-hydroxy-tetrahydrodipicolinate synthase [Armatimonadetes bacterium]|nr:4-hydroxy-tetrahydrodipicolinate synthase [Armatimonadota bacterium]
MFGRLITAMVTPFDTELKVDYDKAGELAERLVKEGSDGLLVAGTTGESPTLTDEEKLELYRVVKEAVGGRAKVIAGTGTNCTAKSIELTKKAEEVGVDGILLVAPYYNKPPQEGLYRHFRAVAEATDLPVLLYNIPSRSAVNLEAKTVARLAEVPNIVGIKEASGNMGQVAEIVRLTGGEFLVYSGNDSDTLSILALGGVGVISVASHLAGPMMKEMIEAYVKGEVSRAAELNAKLAPLFKVLFITTNPIPVKAALEMVGFPVGAPRPPLVEATSDQKAAIGKVLEELGLA